MPPRRKPPSVVREPVQVYLTGGDSAMLKRLVDQSGLSKAEILRRGLRSFAAQQAGLSPMLAFLDEIAEADWPADVALNHDAILADSYRPPRTERR
jgi:hypothetical protein